jgi:superfamily I DNA and/or RNA helicase
MNIDANKLNLILAKSAHFQTERTLSWDGDSNWDVQSDIRLKTDIENESNILSRLLQLDVKNYRWKDKLDSKTKRIGFIAQDVQPLFPALVSKAGNKDDNEAMLTLKYAEFGVLAIGGLKEMKLEKDAEISELKNRLEAEITNLKAQMQQLRDHQLHHQS